MSGRRLAAVVAASLLLGACAGGDAPQPPGAEPGRAAAQAEALEFAAPDGTQLGGLLFRPPGSTAVVVMAHQRGGSSDDWVDLAVATAEGGIAAFPFSFRGYAGQDGKANTDLDVDLAAAVAFMREQGFERIGVAGASMGGTAALQVAAGEDLDAVAALSAPRAFAGLTVRPGGVDEPVLLVSAKDDGDYRRVALELEQQLAEAAHLSVGGAAHGTAILTEHPQVVEQVVTFFAERLGATGP